LIHLSAIHSQDENAHVAGMVSLREGHGALQTKPAMKDRDR
jgi:hypothetical protein